MEKDFSLRSNFPSNFPSDRSKWEVYREKSDLINEN